MDKKIKSVYTLPPRHPSEIQRYTQTKSKELDQIFHATGKENKAAVAILVSHKTDFKAKAIVRDTEGHYIMINE